jgi:hypothetical protein
MSHQNHNQPHRHPGPIFLLKDEISNFMPKFLHLNRAFFNTYYCTKKYMDGRIDGWMVG